MLRYLNIMDTAQINIVLLQPNLTSNKVQENCEPFVIFWLTAEMLKPRFIRSRRQLVRDDGTSDPSSKENLDRDPGEFTKKEEGTVAKHIGPYNIEAFKSPVKKDPSLDLIDLEVPYTGSERSRRRRNRRQANEEQRRGKKLTLCP